MAKAIHYRNEASAEFIKTFNRLMTSRAAWQVWADFISMFAVAISNAVDKENFEAREKEYLQIAPKYSAEEFEIISELTCITTMALEGNMWQDFLGSLYMALELGNHWKGQFFTPYCVTQAMAKISMGNISEQVKEKGFVSVNDCACGGGATLIAAAEIAYEELTVKDKLNWQNHIMFAAQDIDPITAKMCYIQLSLLGCAGYVKIGDSITDPMHEGDDNAKYWYTPMWFSEVWQFRRIWNSLDKIMTSAVKHKANVTKTTETPEDELPEQLTLF